METHSHVFLGEGHEHAERRTWGVIWLCGAMMLLEIAGGLLFDLVSGAAPFAMLGAVNVIAGVAAWLVWRG